MNPHRKSEVGQVVRWGDVIMLIIGRVNTNGGEKWQCLMLESSLSWGWSHAYLPGSLAYFRDIDFSERLA